MHDKEHTNILYNFHILKENNILCSWNTIRVGKKRDLFSNAQISEYAVEYLLEHPQETNQFIVELVCCEKSSSINEILDKVADIFDKKIDEDSDEWVLEMRKLRFCILTYLKSHISNKRELLYKIADVCQDFDFPEDMKGLIYYMPSENVDLSKYTEEEAIERLLKLFEEFLINEKNLLTKI